MAVSLQVMAIVHGKSERYLCESIKSNLRIKHEIIANNKGANSIQITSVMSVLNDRRFAAIGGFTRHFSDVLVKKQKLIDFRLFIIMDTDDCTANEKESFISGKMFQGHWLCDYITPVHNIPNLEETMNRAGVLIAKKRDYFTVFPTNHGDLNVTMAQEFLAKLKIKTCQSVSNLHSYVEYCLRIAEQDEIHVSRARQRSR